jgi:RimJ/RimL family protein N-acetyltransferase
VASWITRVIVDPTLRLAVGRAGFHGPPDAAGTVEVGYAVDPTYRRLGYARAALEQLLERAAREPSVHTVRAAIRPDNLASLRLVLDYGFVEVGEQWDDEDGLEAVFEVAAPGC